jgi:hypothetical protein
VGGEEHWRSHRQDGRPSRPRPPRRGCSTRHTSSARGRRSSTRAPRSWPTSAQRRVRRSRCRR